MRPFISYHSAWVYGAYGAIGGGVGYWLTGVEERQMKWLSDKRDALIEKRKRRAAREGVEVDEYGVRIEKPGVVESIKESLTGGTSA